MALTGTAGATHIVKAHVTLGARFIPLAVLVQLMIACGNQQPDVAGSRASLVVGTVRAGPISPVAQVGRPDTRPLPGATVEALRGSEVVAITHSDQGGRYQLSLHPGAYLIRVKNRGFHRPSPVKTVTLAAGETQIVNFSLDTGIR